MVIVARLIGRASQEHTNESLLLLRVFGRLPDTNAQRRFKQTHAVHDAGKTNPYRRCDASIAHVGKPLYEHRHVKAHLSHHVRGNTLLGRQRLEQEIV